MFVQSRRSRKSAQRCSVFMESLETRQLMTNNGNMWDVDLHTHHEAPPAIVEFAQTSNPDSALPVNPTTDAATETRSISIYNSTWGGPSFGKEVYWARAAAWSAVGAPGGFDLSRTRVEQLARISRDGGRAINLPQDVKPGSMTVMDFEDPHLTNKSPTFIADRLRWFKQTAPDVKVGVFGLTIYPEVSSEDCAEMNANSKAYLTRKIMEYRAVYENSDFICYDVYMLHPKDVERDLKCHMEVAKVFRELFPNKPIIPFVWGAYHDTWNPPHSIISDEVMQRYVQSLARDDDAVMVWGEWEDNAKLVEYLQQPNARVMPVDRKANWANEASVQDPAPTGSRPASGENPGSAGNDARSSRTLIDSIFGDEQALKLA